MQRIPLSERLGRRTHRSVALLQDVLVAQAYDVFPDCVLHGGTAIWRCYGGGRFSEDADVYLPAFSESAGGRFRRSLAAKGLKELKFKATKNTVFGKFSLDDAVVSFEAAIRAPPTNVVRPYELLGGGFMLVNTLTPEALLVEKSAAYLARRMVRDLFDVFFLLNLVEDKEAVAKGVAALVRGYEKPEDVAQLKTLVVSGAVPSGEAMIEAIRRWGRRYT